MSRLYTRLTSTAWREASVATVPELEAMRLEIISRYPNALQRVGALGLHVAAKHTSGAILNLLARPYEAEGLSFIGSGWNSTVLREDGSVVKIVRRTELMGPERRARYMEKLRELIAHNTLCLGDVVVDSHVSEIPHPLSERPVVAITQPYVEGSDALEGDMAPNIREQLRQFATKSLHRMVPNGVAPDLVGPGNVLVSSTESGERIRLVDTVALEDLDIPNASFPLSVKKLQELAKK